MERDLCVHGSPLVRALLIGSGWVCMALGVVGLFLPILPTTPFLLVAAACFSRSSRKFYERLMGNALFGSYIRSWRVDRVIPLKAKLMATLVMVLTLGGSVVFFIPLMAIKVIVGLIGATVLVYIWRFPSE